MCVCKASRQLFKKVSHCIFDLDGIIVDTESRYEQVMGNMLMRFGKELTPEVRLRTLGKPSLEVWKILIKEYQLSINLRDADVEFRTTCQLVLTDCPLLPGAERLIRHLHRNNIPIAIATSSSIENVERKTRHVKELISLFQHVTSSYKNPEVKNGKPSPDIYILCASQFPNKPKPSQCLSIEDSPTGLMAAIDAGMQCIMINHLIPVEQIKDATLILNSLEEFKPEQFGLPPF